MLSADPMDKGDHTDTPDKAPHADTLDKGDHTDPLDKGPHADTLDKGDRTDTIKDIGREDRALLRSNPSARTDAGTEAGSPRDGDFPRDGGSRSPRLFWPQSVKPRGSGGRAPSSDPKTVCQLSISIGAKNGARHRGKNGGRHRGRKSSQTRQNHHAPEKPSRPSGPSRCVDTHAFQGWGTDGPV